MIETSFSDTENYNNPQTTGLPKGLNILTILTFIGCAVFGLLTIVTPWMIKFFLNLMNKTAENSANLTAKQLEDMEASRKLMEAQQLNMMPLLLIGAAGIILCFIGALMMRKLKKDGFWIYTAGQVLPLIGNIAILGMAQFTGVVSYLFLLIPFLFIYLYSRQRKYLIK